MMRDEGYRRVVRALRLQHETHMEAPTDGSRSVRIRAVAVLICVSSTREGRVCGEVGRFEHDEPEGSVDLARRAGWTFRLRAARCPRCGREGNSFGPADRPRAGG